MADEPRLHDHLEIHALIDGGYVIREGRFDSDGAGRQSEWNWRQERAAFATLGDDGVPLSIASRADAS